MGGFPFALRQSLESFAQMGLRLSAGRPCLPSMANDNASGGGIAVRAGAVRNGSHGRFERGGGALTLTEQQKAFVEAFCSNGGNARQACRDAGYLSPHAPSRLLGLTQVRQSVAMTLERKVQGEGASLAWGVLLHLLRDPATPSAVRFQAAKWTLEAGGIGREAQGLTQVKPLAEMSLSDLEATVHASRLALDAIEAEVDAPLSTDEDITLASDAHPSSHPRSEV